MKSLDISTYAEKLTKIQLVLHTQEVEKFKSKFEKDAELTLRRFLSLDQYDLLRFDEPRVGFGLKYIHLYYGTVFARDWRDDLIEKLYDRALPYANGMDENSIFIALKNEEEIHGVTCTAYLQVYVNMPESIKKMLMEMGVLIREIKTYESTSIQCSI